MKSKLSALQKLVEVIDALRGPDGCPWDKAQRLPDMGRHLLGEVAEAVDAIEDSGGTATSHVCEELGDVLMNVFLSARIAEDEGGFDLGDVASGIAEKLVRRHPHVFGTKTVSGVADVLTNWNAIKEEEKRSGAVANRSAPSDGVPSRLDAVPKSLPSLERAHELGRVAAKVGFDWPDAGGAFEKVREELAEVQALLSSHLREAPGPLQGAATGSTPAAPGAPDSGATEEIPRGSAPRMAASSDLPASPSRDLLVDELGDLLFAVANLCRKLGISPDTALRSTLRKFCLRFRAVERKYPEIEKATLDEMESAWNEAKGTSGTAEPIGNPRRNQP